MRCCLAPHNRCRLFSKMLACRRHERCRKTQDFGTSCQQLVDYLNVRACRIQGWPRCRKGRTGWPPAVLALGGCLLLAHRVVSLQCNGSEMGPPVRPINSGTIHVIPRARIRNRQREAGWCRTARKAHGCGSIRPRPGPAVLTKMLSTQKKCIQSTCACCAACNCATVTPTRVIASPASTTITAPALESCV